MSLKVRCLLSVPVEKQIAYTTYAPRRHRKALSIFQCALPSLSEATYLVLWQKFPLFSTAYVKNQHRFWRDCADACIFAIRLCYNGSSHIKHLPLLHYSVVNIFWSFGIIQHILGYWKSILGSFMRPNWSKLASPAPKNIDASAVFSFVSSFSLLLSITHNF